MAELVTSWEVLEEVSAQFGGGDRGFNDSQRRSMLLHNHITVTSDGGGIYLIDRLHPARGQSNLPAGATAARIIDRVRGYVAERQSWLQHTQ
jgi:hypothetical protein